jgi:hypothetical protein
MPKQDEGCRMACSAEGSIDGKRSVGVKPRVPGAKIIPDPNTPSIPFQSAYLNDYRSRGSNNSENVSKNFCVK